MATKQRYRIGSALVGLALFAVSCSNVGAVAPIGCGRFGLAARAACGAGIVAPVVPPTGLLFSNYLAPLETNFEATPVGAKQGTALVRFLQDPIFTGLPILTWGEASIEAAAASGGISKVHYVDYEVLSVVGIFVQLTVRVWGE